MFYSVQHGNGLRWMRSVCRCVRPMYVIFTLGGENNIQQRNSMTRKRRPQRHSMPRPQQLPPAANPQLNAAILDIVDTQLRDRTPPETHATFERLIGLGHTPEGARQLLGHVGVREIFTVM